MPIRAVFFSLWAVLGAALMASCAPGPATPLPAPDQLWNPDSSAVLFRADVVGGTLPEWVRMSETPLCTVYGDGRVVWVNELDAFNTEILFDFVQPAAIEAFIRSMVIDEGFYDLDARATEPPEGESAPVIQVITMDVGQLAHRADSLGSWPLGYFDMALQRCRSISQTPIRFDATEAWVTVREVMDMPDAPSITWDPAAYEGVSLRSLAESGQARWISGPAIAELWRILRTLPYTVVLREGDRTFQVALQVPGITRDAPQRPADQASS